MTTMNYPANYTAIAADEMVYLDGGATIWESISENVATTKNWINLVRNPVYSLGYVASAAIELAKDSPNIASVISNIGYAIGYFGDSIASWKKFPDLIGA